ncbi:MAG: hypothetical protein QE284_13120 [Rhizobium sp.]|nr:hypothetical protein [Rhizobium sp.]
MASPWKFLASLVSPRRQKGPADEKAADRAPEEPGTAGSGKRFVGESLDSVDLPRAKSFRPLHPADGLAAPHGAAGQAVDHHQDTVEPDSSEIEDVSRTQLPDTVVTPADGASNLNETSKAVPTKRKGRTRTVEAVVAASKATPAALAASNEEVSLDDEIRALRGQLVRKLRLQNAQLKKMLERFER